MLAALDVFFTVLKTFFSCLIRPKKLAERSWRGEFIVRLARDLLRRSIGKNFLWVRARQSLLTLYAPDLFRVSSKWADLSGVACLEIHPKSLPEPDTVIVYLHGGGYAVGSAAGYRLMGAKLALLCRAKVLMVDYRLVPEFPLPAAQNDCYALCRHVLEQHANQKVILMGDSAGGALCLSTLKKLDANQHAAGQTQSQPIAACVLISPWLAPLSYENLSLEHEANDMLDRHITQYWVDTFYRSEALKSEVDFSDIQSLGLPAKRWPRLYLQAAGAEVFLAQVKQFSQQLEQQNVDHRFDIYPDQFHVFQTFSPLVPEAKKALADIADFVRSA